MGEPETVLTGLPDIRRPGLFALFPVYSKKIVEVEQTEEK